MEQNLPVIAKKFWNIVRVAFFMLRKSIAKRKLMLDLNLILERGKIASKAAIQNIMFHHTHQLSRHSHHDHKNEYIFTLKQTSLFNNLPFNFNKKKYNKKHDDQEEDVVVVNAAVMKALEMIQSETAAAASPALPGFGRTPMVRQLRVTDSPFPLRDDIVDHDSHVDEAAEEFISKFYKNLRWQASPCA